MCIVHIFAALCSYKTLTENTLRDICGAPEAVLSAARGHDGRAVGGGEGARLTQVIHQCPHAAVPAIFYQHPGRSGRRRVLTTGRGSCGGHGQ